MAEGLTQEEERYEAYMADVGVNNLAKSRKPKTAITEQESGELIISELDLVYRRGQILALIKEAGYVKLAEDQIFPINPLSASTITKDDTNRWLGYNQAQQDMLKANWRKVILENPGD